MGTYQLFVGSNNTTHKLEVAKMQEVLNRLHEGYTILPTAVGVWHGITEKSAVIFITCNQVKAVATAELLRDELEQEAVALMQAPEMRFI